MKKSVSILILVMGFYCDPSFAIEVLEHKVAKVTETGAVIKVRFDEETTAQIRYGVGTSRLNEVSISLMANKDHTFYLSGLKKGTEYSYQVVVPLPGGKEYGSPSERFKTRGIPKPLVTSSRVIKKTKDGGVLRFTTNTPTTHAFNCGMDKSLGYRGASDRFQTEHVFGVSQFFPLTEVFYEITFTNKLGETIVQRGSFISGENNAAKGKSVTGTFTRKKFDNFVTDTPPMLTRITDGSLDYFRGMATSGDPARSEQWVQVDLGEPHTLDKILTYWRALAYPKKYTLSTSVDGETWKTIDDNLNVDDGEKGRSKTGDPMIVHTVDANRVLARYVRMSIPAGSPCYQKYKSYKFVQLFELKVYPHETYGLRIKQ